MNSKKLDKERLLEQLSMLRGMLTGELDPKLLLESAPAEVQAAAKEKTDGGNRRLVALAMIDAIGTEVHSAIEEEKKLLDGRIFGYANWTAENQKKKAG